MRLAISIKMDPKIRDLMTNSGEEDQAILEKRALMAATLIDARDKLDALMSTDQSPHVLIGNQTFPPPPSAIKITVREGGDMPQTPLVVNVKEDANEKQIIRTVRDELRKNSWPS